MVFYELQFKDTSSKGIPWISFYHTKGDAQRDAVMLKEMKSINYQIFKREWTTDSTINMDVWSCNTHRDGDPGIWEQIQFGFVKRD